MLIMSGTGQESHVTNPHVLHINTKHTSLHHTKQFATVTLDEAMERAAMHNDRHECLASVYKMQRVDGGQEARELDNAHRRHCAPPSHAFVGREGLIARYEGLGPAAPPVAGTRSGRAAPEPKMSQTPRRARSVVPAVAGCRLSSSVGFVRPGVNTARR